MAQFATLLRARAEACAIFRTPDGLIRLRLNSAGGNSRFRCGDLRLSCAVSAVSSLK